MIPEAEVEVSAYAQASIAPPHRPAGRSSGRPPAPGRLDRAAFELAVADAAELLQSQLR